MRAEGDDRLSLRTTFDRVAEVYGDRRPPLPEGWLDTLAELAGLPPGGRVLEVGCGPGRATMALAEQGHPVVAVELGADLAAEAARRLAAFSAVEVVAEAFERWPPPDRYEPFDLVLAVDAWHWVDPAVRTARAAELLRPGGAVAVVSGHHVAGGDTAFFDEAMRCYERHMPGTRPGERLLEPDALPPEDWSLAASASFGPTEFRRWVTETTYTTASYLDLLATFSGHIALAPADRQALFACLAELLERDYGGRLRRATLTELCVARRSRPGGTVGP